MQLQERLDEFSALEAEVWAISPDSADSLGQFTTKAGVEIPMLLDPDLDVAKAYGIAAGKVPHPTVVIVAPDGTVTYWRVDEDFSQRPSPDELLSALGRDDGDAG